MHLYRMNGELIGEGVSLVEICEKNRASLYNANLFRANLFRANLVGARLVGARLVGARLDGARLDGASLVGASLDGASLDGASLVGVMGLHYSIVPSGGEFRAWKALANGAHAWIEIPAWAQRHSCITSRKCRCSAAFVLAIWDKRNQEITECCGRHDRNLRYRVGELVFPDRYDPDPRIECSAGIHFFMTRAEAQEWARS